AYFVIGLVEVARLDPGVDGHHGKGMDLLHQEGEAVGKPGPDDVGGERRGGGSHACSLAHPPQDIWAKPIPSTTFRALWRDGMTHPFFFKNIDFWSLPAALFPLTPPGDVQYDARPWSKVDRSGNKATSIASRRLS